ncbi:hypothetical protein CROQUDRAFT_651592 [Cronartium quercuum f. sp. fusiforme G11]|uniref:Phosphatidylglycerol/phosphatidylinositol transfer protein n=1 Tax=Cronartium quercuum f. sp. fusiforme G11 TaxID=708437 RepID=A0A9P6TG46_9BASI|nr:hypothetical protein CROQUDRAFT_651592 [Cronartium quercuum f. sp. fusiforme G11]
MRSFESLSILLCSILLAQTTVATWSPDLLQSDMLAKLSDKFISKNPSTQTVWNFEDCGTLETDAITIDDFEISPDPPQPGQKLIITASGTANQLIEEGAYADVVVKLGAYIKILHKQFDICEELRNANATIQCPIEKGQHSIIHTVELPSQIPKAKFTVEARAFTVSEDDLACANVMIDFMKPDEIQ